jgi:hypothetical protein
MYVKIRKKIIFKITFEIVYFLNSYYRCLMYDIDIIIELKKIKNKNDRKSK